MNARSYRVNLNHSPLDFPEILWLGQTSVSYQSEPHIDKNNVVLTITKKFVLTDMNNKDHEVFSVQSNYKIPSNLIKNRQDVYEFYKDATLSLYEEYQFARTKMSALPNLQLPNIPLEKYKGEIDRVLNLLISRN